MEQLIFFGVLIAFSILDFMAKKARQRQAEAEAEAQEEVERPEEVVLGTDGLAERQRARQREASGLEAYHRRGEGVTAYEPNTLEADPSTSESMVPRDIWEEIGALARGEIQPPAETEIPAEPASAPSPIRREQVGSSWEVGSRRSVGEHPIHLSHAGYGTDPSERLQRVETRGPSRSQADARAVRSLLRHGDRSELRQALVLQEILGPPAALKDE